MNVEHYKALLEEEKKRLEGELSKIATRSKTRPGDWEPTPVDINPQVSAPEEMADKFEEIENAVASESELEQKLVRVEGALLRIAEGTYGTCSVGNDQIPEARLEADPSATTCTKHAEEA